MPYPDQVALAQTNAETRLDPIRNDGVGDGNAHTYRATSDSQAAIAAGGRPIPFAGVSFTDDNLSGPETALPWVATGGATVGGGVMEIPPSGTLTNTQVFGLKPNTEYRCAFSGPTSQGTIGITLGGSGTQALIGAAGDGSNTCITGGTVDETALFEDPFSTGPSTAPAIFTITEV